MNKVTKRKKTKSASNASTATAREDLMKAARHQFALKGLSGTSIRNIASAASINSSMISYYFKGKQGLYIECLKEIGKKQLEMSQNILTPPKNRQELEVRLGLFIDSIFDLFLNDRDAGLIIIREYDRHHSPGEKIFTSTLLKVFDLLIDFIKSSQKSKLISKTKDPFILASLFFGALVNMMRMDHIKEKHYDFSIKKTGKRNKVKAHLIGMIVN
ncbi:MAG: TetR family transcriptional regulator [Bdellovibrionales bacterium]|nr:TetR family transcriptional regulator [Bdellovibrionales bacterium]